MVKPNNFTIILPLPAFLLLQTSNFGKDAGQLHLSVAYNLKTTEDSSVVKLGLSTYTKFHITFM